MTYNSINFIEFPSIEDAIQSTEKHILITLRREEFIASDIELAKLAVIEKLEIDIRYWDYSDADALFSCLVQLPNLVGLRLEGCKIKSVPASIGQLKNLLFLSLKRNEISELPKELKELERLEAFNLAYNEFVVFPEVVTEISSLIELDVERNKLVNISENICALENLYYFDFSFNRIEFLTFDLLEMKKLTHASFNRRTANPDYQKSLGDRYGKTDRQLVKNIESFIEEIDDPLSIKHLTFGNRGHQFKDKELTIPTFIQNYSNLKSLQFHYIALFTTLPEELIKLKKLEIIQCYGSKESNFISFPISSFKNLYDLTVRNISQKDFENLLHSKTLRELSLYSKSEDFTFRYSQINKFKKFTFSARKIILQDDTNEIISDLKSLHISATEIKEMELFQLLEKTPNLSSLLIKVAKGNLKDFSFLDKLPQLQHLTIDFTGDDKYNYPDLFARLARLENIKSIRLTLNETYIPIETDLINRLGKPRAILLYSIKNVHSKLSDWFRMELAMLKEPVNIIIFREASIKPPIGKLNSFIEKYKDYEISKMGREILFTIFMDKVEDFKRILSELKPAPHDQNSSFFVSGEIIGMTKEEIKDGCKKANIQLENEFNETVSHIVITDSVSHDIDLYLNSNASILSQNAFKNILWENNKPFLTEEDNSAMNDRVLDLFFSNQTENIGIAIQLLKTGGLTNLTTSLVLATSIYHPDENVKQEAKIVFNKFASEGLISFEKLIWKKFRHIRPTNDFFFSYLAKIPELNTFELCIFIFHIRHLNNSEFKGIKNLEVKGSFDKCPDLLLRCPELSKLKISDCPNIDFEHFFDYLLQFPKLEHLSIQHNNLEQIIAGISKLKNLDSLEIKCTEVVENANNVQLKSNVKRAKFTLTIKNGNFDLSGLPHVSRLSINDSDIHKFIGIDTLSNLRELNLDNNKTLTEVPSAIYSLPKLKNLSMNNCKIHSVPIDLGKIPRLRHVSFSYGYEYDLIRKSSRRRRR